MDFLGDCAYGEEKQNENELRGSCRIRTRAEYIYMHIVLDLAM